MSVRRIVARSERGEEVVFRRDAAAARSVPQGGAQLAAGGFYVLPLAFAHDGRHVFVPQHFFKGQQRFGKNNRSLPWES